MKKVFLSLITVCQICLATDYRHVRDNSRIPSYDTTYVEGQDSFRQIYISDGKSETYILLRNDSIILWDVEKH